MFYKTVKETNDWGKEVEYQVLDTKKVTIAIASGIATFIIFILLCLSVCKIPTGHTGVVTSFGKVQNYTLDAGIHVKAPWQRVIKMDNRVQKQSIELSCFSSDIQEVKIIYTVNYQIDKANAMTIYSTIGKEYYDIAVVPNITESVKVVTAKFTAEKLVGTREKLAQAIEKDLTERLKDYNIELVSTSIEDMDFTDAYTNAVEAKQVAQQNKLKAETEAEQKVIEAEANAEVARIKAQGNADAKKIAAEAESKANEMLSKSLTDKVLKNKWYEKWDGKYPQVVSGGGTIIEFPMD